MRWYVYRTVKRPKAGVCMNNPLNTLVWHRCHACSRWPFWPNNGQHQPFIFYERSVGAPGYPCERWKCHCALGQGTTHFSFLVNSVFLENPYLTIFLQGSHHIHCQPDYEGLISNLNVCWAADVLIVSRSHVWYYTYWFANRVDNQRIAMEFRQVLYVSLCSSGSNLTFWFFPQKITNAPLEAWLAPPTCLPTIL